MAYMFIQYIQKYSILILIYVIRFTSNLQKINKQRLLKLL